MRTVINSALLCALLPLLQTTASFGQSFTLLHAFGTNADGRSPIGGVTLCESTLYGTTFEGDNSSGYFSGIIYSISTNGSNYTILHSFSGSDGENPTTIPVVSNGIIYGTTYAGGSNNDGVIYRLGASGSNSFNILHTFDGSGGTAPNGDLLLAGGTLYGTTAFSSPGAGAIYSICTNGSNFTVLYSFTGGADGAKPNSGQLVLSSNTLYGMTSAGGTSNYGVIYSVWTNGSNFTVLHTFTPAGGVTPMGNLVLSGNTLYGTTELGGSNGFGTVFSIGIDGSNYTQLHVFTIDSDVANPVCTLLLSSNILYGTTENGGNGNAGTVFSINTDGSDFQVLYEFSAFVAYPYNSPTPTNSDGYNPLGTLSLSGTNLYGIAAYGGPNAGGTLFQLTLPPPAQTTPPFFTGQYYFGDNWYYLGPQGGNQYGFGYYMGYYFPIIWHLDLGWEYYVDAGNANHGAYFYDFADNVFFYTEPGLFPNLYDFKLNAWLYCAPQTGQTDRYQSNPRYFYNYSTGQWITAL
jgi:uncharacterized repeat protein (TIGR03803 family)